MSPVLLEDLGQKPEQAVRGHRLSYFPVRMMNPTMVAFKTTSMAAGSVPDLVTVLQECSPIFAHVLPLLPLDSESHNPRCMHTDHVA
jgi:hypothetical protein